MKPYINVIIWIILGLAIGLVVSSIFISPKTNPPQNQNLPNHSQPNPQQNNSTMIPNQPTKAEISIFVIEAPACPKCNELNNFLLQQTQEQIDNSSTVKVGVSKTISPDSEEAKMLISKYNITLLPSMVISNSSLMKQSMVDVWAKQLGSVEPDGSLVERNVYPPYYDLSNNTYYGFVSGIAISASNCPACMNASYFMESLEKSSLVSMAFSNKTILEENSTQAQNLIKKYNITKLPTLFLSSDVMVYPVFNEIATYGEMKDGWFILRSVKPPFVDLTNHSIRGYVDAVYIVNSSCTDCFDISGLSDYLVQSAGIELSNTTSYEINSTQGAALVKKYNLTAIPTLLFSPELSVYPHMKEIWLNQTNSIEADGWYVFRSYQYIQKPYQNLT